jgi:menaquinone-dependent protoporphyrinogen oxidase
MDGIVLVTYASVMGSTTGIAKVIGDELRASGAVVHVLPVRQVSRIENYRSVILGSPIYEGQWLEEAVAFLEHYRTYLSHIPVAYFVVSAVRETFEERQQRAKRVLELVLHRTPEVKPTDIGVFSGAFNSKQWTLPALLALKAKGELPPDGDCRDWLAIRAWAYRIHPHLISESKTVSV